MDCVGEGVDHFKRFLLGFSFQKKAHSFTYYTLYHEICVPLFRVIVIALSFNVIQDAKISLTISNIICENCLIFQVNLKECETFDLKTLKGPLDYTAVANSTEALEKIEACMKTWIKQIEQVSNLLLCGV